MKKPNAFLLAVVSGLLLSACDKPDDPVAALSPAIDDNRTEVAPLDRKLDPTQIAHGLAVYDKHCAECHGVEGRGLPGDWRVRDAEGNFPAPPLDDSAHAWHHPTAALLYVIYEGSPGGAGNMPAWKGKLSEQEMLDVVVYIKSLWSDPVYRQWLRMEQQSQGG